MTKPALDLRREDFPDLQGPRLDQLLRALNAYGAATSQAIGGSIAGDGWFTKDVTFTGKDEWVAPSLLNSWVNQGADEVAGYRRDAAGMVWLRGTVKSGTVNAPIMQLPTGYRPRAQVAFTLRTVGGSGFEPGYIKVGSDGNVTLEAGGNLATALDGIMFHAADPAPAPNPCFPVRFKNDLGAKPSHVLVTGAWRVGANGTETPVALGNPAWSESRGEIVLHDLGNVLAETKYRVKLLVMK